MRLNCPYCGRIMKIGERFYTCGHCKKAFKKTSKVFTIRVHVSYQEEKVKKLLTELRLPYEVEEIE